MFFWVSNCGYISAFEAGPRFTATCENWRHSGIDVVNHVSLRCLTCGSNSCILILTVSLSSPGTT